jgi:hypothetical protein
VRVSLGLRYNPAVRLIVTITWCLAALLWTPWALIALRLLVELALGTPFSQSAYVAPALMGLWPSYSWWSWHVVSWYPICALLGIGLSAAGWRLYWWNEDGISTRPAQVVALSILCPLLAPCIMWRDARARHQARQAGLQAAVADAQQRQPAAR